jgi:hypothetical protein
MLVTSSAAFHLVQDQTPPPPHLVRDHKATPRPRYREQHPRTRILDRKQLQSHAVMNNGNGFYAPGPPMMNPPPRIFGSGQFDPSQIPQGSMFAQDDYDDHGDQSDPKRRRIARVHTTRGAVGQC